MTASGMSWGAAALLGALIACSAPAPEVPEVLAGPVPEDAPAAELRAVTYEGWQQVLAEHRGQVVVVDLWATWCIPCIERFPQMVELSREYGPQGVTFLSMSLDDRDDPGALRRAEAFLAEQDAGFDHYRLDEPMLDGFDKFGLLSIPAVLVFDREGNLSRKLTTDDPNQQFTETDVEEAVRSLLG